MVKKLRSLFFFFLFFLVFFIANDAQAYDKYAIETAKKYYDLYPESMIATPTKPMILQPCQIMIKVKNNGTIALNSSKGLSDFNYTFDNFKMTKLEYPSPNYNNMILSGGYANYHFEGYFTSVGESKLVFTADSANELDESKIGDKSFTVTLEDNNIMNQKITVLPVGYTDIGIESFALGNPYPVAGEPFDFFINVKNYGQTSLTNDDMTSDNEINADFTGFNKKLFTRDTTPSLNNPLNTSEKIVYKYNGSYPQAGIYTFSFQLDKNNRVVESNETNNSSSTKIRVYASQTEVDKVNIKSYGVDYYSSSSVRIFWETDRETTSRLFLRRINLYNYDEPSSWTTRGLKHSIDYNDLQANTNYYYQIITKATTTPVYAEFVRFTTPASDQPKIVSGPSVTQSGNITKLSWSTDLFSNSQIYYYKLATSTWQYKKNDTKTAVHDFELKDLATGQYEYYIVSSSTAGLAARSKPSRFSIGCTNCSAPATGNANKSAETSYSKFTVPTAEIAIKNQSMYKNMLGKIVMKVESKGEAYYIHPTKQRMFSLGRPEDAFEVMRAQGIGISNANLNSIPLAAANLSGVDTDKDGLPDAFEDAIGTDKSKADTDGDKFNDKTEISGSFNPKGSGKISLNSAFANASKGKIFLQVENKGEAWYINPVDGKRYFLGRPADAFAVMRTLGVGISNNNFNSL